MIFLKTTSLFVIQTFFENDSSPTILLIDDLIGSTALSLRCTSGNTLSNTLPSKPLPSKTSFGARSLKNLRWPPAKELPENLC